MSFQIQEVFSEQTIKSEVNWFNDRESRGARR